MKVLAEDVSFSNKKCIFETTTIKMNHKVPINHLFYSTSLNMIESITKYKYH